MVVDPASLRAAFRTGLSPLSPNAGLNTRIANSILSCFPSEAFDSTGLLRSPWLMRLTDVADDTQGMIAELLAETPVGTAKPHATRHQGLSRFSRRDRRGS